MLEFLFFLSLLLLLNNLFMAMFSSLEVGCLSRRRSATCAWHKKTIKRY